MKMIMGSAIDFIGKTMVETTVKNSLSIKPEHSLLNWHKQDSIVNIIDI